MRADICIGIEFGAYLYYLALPRINRSGVAMISSITLAELSILFSMSDLSLSDFSLSALQPNLHSSRY
jgi:hypothetical protein